MKMDKGKLPSGKGKKGDDGNRKIDRCTSCCCCCYYHLLLFFFTGIVTTFLGSSKSFTLSLDTSSSSTTIRTCEGKVNVLLRVQSYDEGRNIDNLLSYSNVTLSDKNSGVMNRLGQTRLVYLSLKTSFKEIFNLES